MKRFLHELTYEEAQAYFSEKDIVLLPVGSVEQHGPANPLGTDALIAEALAKEAAKRTGVLSLPLIPFGISFHHMDFPGTTTVDEEALISYVMGVIRSLAKWGVRKVLVVNGHGGNLPSLQIVARKASTLGVRVYVYQWWTSGSKILADLFEPDERGHAAAAETSLIMYLHPELVNDERVVDERPRLSHEGEVYSFHFTKESTRSGVYGRQSSASRERGKELFERLIEDLERIIEDIER